MYSMENYIWGLVVYALGAGIVFWYSTWLLGHLRYRHIRNVLNLLVFALVFTPIQPYAEQSFLAPAFVTLVFESMLLGSEEEPLRGLIPIFFVYGLLIFGYVVYAWCWQRPSQHKTMRRAKP